MGRRWNVHDWIYLALFTAVIFNDWTVVHFKLKFLIHFVFKRILLHFVYDGTVLHFRPKLKFRQPFVFKRILLHFIYDGTVLHPRLKLKFRQPFVSDGNHIDREFSAPKPLYNRLCAYNNVYHHILRLYCDQLPLRFYDYEHIRTLHNCVPCFRHSRRYRY
jgi:hypothetical protein